MSTYTVCCFINALNEEAEEMVCVCVDFTDLPVPQVGVTSIYHSVVILGLSHPFPHATQLVHPLLGALSAALQVRGHHPQWLA